MKKITVEHIQDKMILAKDICGPSGNILLGNGTQLSVSLGRRLKNWGIDFVFIDSEEESAAPQNAPRLSMEDAEKNLEEKFSDVIENPLMKKIFSAVQRHFISKGLA